MKNQALHRLNFCELLGYPDEFQPMHWYDQALKCSSFCTKCEESGILNEAGGKLTLISHGCDTSDFETIFAAALPVRHPVALPVMFLLEDPGGDYDLGEELTYNGITKKPPVKHYYWSSALKHWPSSPDELPDYYGSYFAYLMRRHSLSNVYITNLVKCKRIGVEKPWLVEECCVSRFLAEEIKEFSPVVIFCFGRNKVFNPMRVRFPEQHCICLYHPEFIRWRCYGQGLSPVEAINENDRKIDEEIKGISAHAHHPGPP